MAVEYKEVLPSGLERHRKADTVGDLLHLMALFPPDRVPSMATVEKVRATLEKEDAKRSSANDPGKPAGAGEEGPQAPEGGHFVSPVGWRSADGA